MLLRQGAPIRDAWNSGASYAQAAKDVSGLLVFALDIDSAAVYPIDGHDRIDLQERRDVAAVVVLSPDRHRHRSPPFPRIYAQSS